MTHIEDVIRETGAALRAYHAAHGWPEYPAPRSAQAFAGTCPRCTRARPAGAKLCPDCERTATR